MSGLYPSLEDFKYDILINSKHPASNIGTHLRGICGQPNGTSINYPQASLMNSHSASQSTKYDQISLYPSLNNNCNGNSPYGYMNGHYDDANSIGAQSSALLIPGKTPLKAPLSGYSQVHKFQPSNAIRSVVISKHTTGKVGLRLADVQGGIFVVLVYDSSPAAMAGLRFGDQILEINDIAVAGYSMKKVHDIIKKTSSDELRLAVRDRPFERTVTLHKGQNGLVGFLFNKYGRIVSIVKDSSAARNGLLIDHHMIEINAQNVIGFGEHEIRNILDNCGDVVVLTIVPSKIFERLVKDTNPKLLKQAMDHSIPEP